MFTQRLVPIVVLKDLAHAAPLAEALLAGGLDVIELTLRTECALSALKFLAENYPQLKLGAGTVLDPEVVPRLLDIGCQFAVSPGLNPLVVEACDKASLPLYPGVATATEIENARSLGLRTLKFFPAEPLGGVPMLKALIGPYGHTGIRLVPTGSITLEKLPAYAALPEVEAIGGSWFVDGKLMAEGNWEEITKRTKEAIQVIEGNN